MTWGCSHAGFGQRGSAWLVLIISPPSLYFTTFIKSHYLYLELGKKTGNGFYSVPDPEMTEAIIETIVRMSKRQIVKTEEYSRQISQEVKNVVWQRDQARCVQCGATNYLEYDHIIPYSKGGASSVNNVQLLCRRCNLAKSDRI